MNNVFFSFFCDLCFIDIFLPCFIGKVQDTCLFHNINFNILMDPLPLPPTTLTRPQFILVVCKRMYSVVLQQLFFIIMIIIM